VRGLARIGIAALLALVAAPSGAQTYPSKPVRVIVSFPPAGASDASARIFAEKLSLELGQQFIVDNRAGASGVIGHEACAKAPNDGYTLCLGTLGALGLLPHVRKLPYDPLKDFTLIGRVTDAVFAFASLATAPWNSIEEFAALARQASGQYTLSNSGIGTITHLAGETMAAHFGIALTMVPYRGGVEQMRDLLAGQVSMTYESNFVPQVRAGKVKALAVSTPFRHPHLPHVPAMREIIPDWDMPSWFAFMGPAGLPEIVVQRVSRILNKISDLPDVQERVLAMGLKAINDTPQAATLELAKQHANFGRLVQKFNIKVE
jgi:tripartite-type tricarboxylate transporter receptor subunit TctC